MSERLRLAFIAGPPRTGTTLLQTLLDGVPGVASGPELDVLPDLARLRGALHARVDAGRHDVYFDGATVDDACSAFLQTLLAGYAARRHAQVFVDKTPWNVLEAPALLDMLPNARMVLCIRDPRANVQSLLEVGRRAERLARKTPWMTHDLAAAIFTVKKCADAVLAAREAYPRRTRVVRFEDLVSNTRNITEEVCAFLDLPFDDEILHPERRPHDAALAADGAWYAADDIGRAPDPTRADAWRREIAPDVERRVTAAFLGDPTFRALGYEFQPDSAWSPAWQTALARTRLERLLEHLYGEVRARGRRVHALRELTRRARLGGWG
jgi:hypothetical protein